jgi:translation elongation factor EF-G
VLLGHYGSGKTTLSEVMAFKSGPSNGLAALSTYLVSDYDPSEIERHIAQTLAAATGIEGIRSPLDAPGYLTSP